MIYTVTFNPSIDYIMFTDGFELKGLNISLCIRCSDYDDVIAQIRCTQHGMLWLRHAQNMLNTTF
jgi:hypothetical protein